MHLSNVSIPNHAIEKSPIQYSAVEALLYINEKHQFKPHTNLNIYMAYKIESDFEKIFIPKRINIIAGYFYIHPCITIFIFNYYHFNRLLKNLPKESNKKSRRNEKNIVARNELIPIQEYESDSHRSPEKYCKQLEYQIFFATHYKT